MDTTRSITVDLPQRFVDDSISRGVTLAETIVKRLSRTYRLVLDEAAYRELLGDAWHYEDATMFDGCDGICSSARAVARRLLAAETPWAKPEHPDVIERRREAALTDEDKAEREANVERRRARREALKVGPTIRLTVDVGDATTQVTRWAFRNERGYEVEPRGFVSEVTVWHQGDAEALLDYLAGTQVEVIEAVEG